MFASKLRLAVVAATSSLALAGCMSPYGSVGAGYGSNGYYGGYGTYGAYGGYSPYGNYGSYGGYSPYGYGSYGSNPYGYSPYGGWYDNYYYPGTGYYVYTRDGSRQRWTDAQRRYWESRRAQRRDRDGDGSHHDGGHRGGDGSGHHHRGGDGGTATNDGARLIGTPIRIRSWPSGTSQKAPSSVRRSASSSESEQPRARPRSRSSSDGEGRRGRTAPEVE